MEGIYDCTSISPTNCKAKDQTAKAKDLTLKTNTKAKDSKFIKDTGHFKAIDCNCNEPPYNFTPTMCR